jgi:flavin reductase (DIM6/NTAB) family NADH-FMN oxidoreductase RutF
MPLEAREFRRVMSHWMSGVAVIGTRGEDGKPRGFTATAVSSLSLHPPLLLVCVARSARTHDCIRDAAIFAVNMLASDQQRIAKRFAAREGEVRKFHGVKYRTAHTGAPILEGVLAWADCEVRGSHEEGDHTIFIGEILAGDARDGVPLTYFRGNYAPR